MKSELTQRELVNSVRILTDVMWKMGTYLFQHTNDENLKKRLISLGQELKQIRTPKNR